MRTYVSAALGLAVVLAAAAASAQPAVDELERELRQQAAAAVQPPQQGPPAAANPAGPHGYLGVMADDRQDRGRGVRVLEVFAGGPAEKAGLKPQDLILSMAGVRVRSMDDLSGVLATTAPNQKVAVELLRDARQLAIELTLGLRAARPGEPPAAQPPSAPPTPQPPPPVEPPGPPTPAALQNRVQALEKQSARCEQLERRVQALEEQVRRLQQRLEKPAAAEVPVQGQFPIEYRPWIQFGPGGFGWGEY